MFLSDILDSHMEAIAGGTRPKRCAPVRPPVADCCPTLTRSVSDVSGSYNANIVGNDEITLSGGSFIQIGPYAGGDQEF